MDIISHTLWGWIYSKFANNNIKKKWNTKWTILCSILPDLISFIPLTIWIITSLFLGTLTFQKMSGIHPFDDQTIINSITNILYSITHSLLIFLAVFFICWIIFKRPIFELTGWLVHILIDIPSHSIKFFATPLLWPLSNITYDGIAWANPIFLILNFSSIIICFILLRTKALPSKSQHESQKSHLHESYP